LQTIEWPTITLAAFIYGGWLAVTYFSYKFADLARSAFGRVACGLAFLSAT
jgi:hypothetical protein